MWVKKLLNFDSVSLVQGLYNYPVRCAHNPPPCRIFISWNVFFLGCSWFWVTRFSWFWAILHPWREQSNTGSDKNECVSIHFRRSVDGACFWPMQHRASYFLLSFCHDFSTILNNFCIHGVSKATPGTTKMNAFWCIFAGQATVWVFDHCNTGCDIFRAHFAVILDAFWRHFARFWTPV